MIRHIHIENFKSLGGFDMPMSQFNCLVGLNGAGKTTLLQAIDFLSHVMLGQVDEWLSVRGWKSRDLTCRLTEGRHIVFRVDLSLPGNC